MSPRLRPRPLIERGVPAYIHGLRADGQRADALAAALYLDVQRACSFCARPTWIRRRDLIAYDLGTAITCSACMTERER